MPLLSKPKSRLETARFEFALKKSKIERGRLSFSDACVLDNELLKAVTIYLENVGTESEKESEEHVLRVLESGASPEITYGMLLMQLANETPTAAPMASVALATETTSSSMAMEHKSVPPSNSATVSTTTEATRPMVGGLDEPAIETAAPVKNQTQKEILAVFKQVFEIDINNGLFFVVTKLIEVIAGNNSDRNVGWRTYYVNMANVMLKFSPDPNWNPAPSLLPTFQILLSAAHVSRNDFNSDEFALIFLIMQQLNHTFSPDILVIIKAQQKSLQKRAGLLIGWQVTETDREQVDPPLLHTTKFLLTLEENEQKNVESQLALFKHVLLYSQKINVAALRQALREVCPHVSVPKQDFQLFQCALNAAKHYDDRRNDKSYICQQLLDEGFNPWEEEKTTYSDGQLSFLNSCAKQRLQLMVKFLFTPNIFNQKQPNAKTNQFNFEEKTAYLPSKLFKVFDAIKKTIAAEQKKSTDYGFALCYEKTITLANELLAKDENPTLPILQREREILQGIATQNPNAPINQFVFNNFHNNAQVALLMGLHKRLGASSPVATAYRQNALFDPHTVPIIFGFLTGREASIRAAPPRLVANGIAVTGRKGDAAKPKPTGTEPAGTEAHDAVAGSGPSVTLKN